MCTSRFRIIPDHHIKWVKEYYSTKGWGVVLFNFILAVINGEFQVDEEEEEESTQSSVVLCSIVMYPFGQI